MKRQTLSVLAVHKPFYISISLLCLRSTLRLNKLYSSVLKGDTTCGYIFSRPGKSVQCSSDPECTFSNVPRKYVKTTGKFERALSSENNISFEEHSQSVELDYVGWNICEGNKIILKFD